MTDHESNVLRVIFDRQNAGDGTTAVNAEDIHCQTRMDFFDLKKTLRQLRAAGYITSDASGVSNLRVTDKGIHENAFENALLMLPTQFDGDPKL